MPVKRRPVPPKVPGCENPHGKKQTKPTVEYKMEGMAIELGIAVSGGQLTKALQLRSRTLLAPSPSWATTNLPKYLRASFEAERAKAGMHKKIAP